MGDKISYHKTGGKWWKCDATPCDLVTWVPHKMMSSKQASALNRKRRRREG